MNTTYINKPDILKWYIYKILLIMRLTTVILMVSMLQVSASTVAQEFNYVKKGVPLIQVFKEIKKQTGYNIVWNEKKIDVTTTIDADFKKATIHNVLNKCLRNLPLSYSINDKMVMIKENEPSFRDKVGSFFTAIDVRGRVVDGNNQPLAGATVQVKNSIRNTRTDDNGFFILHNIDEGSVLVISYVGYDSKEIRASENLKSISLILSTDKLQEVEINAGYYTVKDKERTGSISRITSKTIEQQPISNALQAVQNRIPGLQITQQTGVPGGGFKVQIRGRSSINTFVGNDPLYIIDGVLYPATKISSNSLSGILSPEGSNPLSFINPYDIESIEVLKDADATAIYGSRGANGVILITTKKNNLDNTKVNVGITHGFSQTGHKLDLLNTEQYLLMRTEAFGNDMLKPSTTDYDVNGTWDQNRYTDWQKELIGDRAQVTRAVLNITGGNEKSNYLIGGNYYKEGTVFPGDFGFTRSGFHTSINLGSDKDRFKANFTTNYTFTKSDLYSSDITQYITLAPNAPDPYDQYGKINWSNNTVYLNPMAVLLQTNNSGTDNLIGNVDLSYRILENLILKTSLGYTTIKREEFTKLPLKSIPPDFGPTTSSRVSGFTNNFNKSLVLEPLITYRLNIGEGNIDALMGASFQENKSGYRTIRATGFNSDELMENIGSASILTNSSNLYSQYRYSAIFARINYGTRSKYFLNLTARRDGSSRFGEGKQFANFGAVGAAWIFSNETLIKKNLPFLSLGKLRISYGITGNDQIPDYGYLQLWKSLGTYQGMSTISSTRIANPNFAWETNKKAEAAIQLGFFNNKISLEVSYYRNRSSNQLVGSPLPLSTGNGSIQANLPATVQNSGLEVMSTFLLVDKNNLKWSTEINLTIPKNKLVSYPGGIENSGYGNTYVIGAPLTIRKIYNVMGIDRQTGLYNIEDKDGNGTLDNKDKYLSRFIGQNYYGGVHNSISFKKFSLDFFFSFNKQKGIGFLPGVYSPGFFDPYGPTSNQPVAVLQRWQQANDQTSFQKFSTTFDSYLSYYSAVAENGGVAIVDASFIRLKNLSLSYNLSSKWVKNMKISNIKLNLQGQNIFTLTNYIGLDPESQSLQMLPPLRSLSLGLNITF